MTRTKRDLMDALPRYYDDSPEVDAIMGANATEIDRVRRNARDVTDQFYVRTATHGLDTWERVLALSPRPNSTLAFRRNRILARLNGTAPATVANLTEVVNAHVANKDARIVEYNGEYRFEAEIPANNAINTALIYRAVNEVKPAHLAFGITAIIREVIRLTARAYDFPVTYRITNTFHTAEVKGGLSQIPFALSGKAYAFEVLYPVTNTFVTAPIAFGNIDNNVVLTEEYRNNDILYKRAGTIYAGEGDI